MASQAGGALIKIGALMASPFLATLRHSEALKEKINDITKTLSDALTPALLPLVDEVAKIVNQFAAWAQKNPQLVREILKISAGLIVAGSALKFIAVTALLLSVSLKAAAILSAAPLLAVVAAVGLAVAAWATFTERGRQSAAIIGQSLREALKPLMDIAGSAFGAALAGQFKVAGEVLAAALELAFLGAISRTLEKAIVPILSKIPGMGGMLSGVLTGAASKTLAERIGITAGELTRAMADANAARGGIGVGGDSQRGPLSAASAGGAIALTFGQGQSMAAKTYAELQQIKRGIYELVKKAQMEQFRRDRPGLFGP